MKTFEIAFAHTTERHRLNAENLEGALTKIKEIHPQKFESHKTESNAVMQIKLLRFNESEYQGVYWKEIIN